MGFSIRQVWPYLLIVLFGFMMFFPIFGSGFLVYLDNPLHLAESYAFIDNVKEHGWISGWSMDAFVGHPLQLFPRYQIGVWLVAVLNLVFFIPVELAYKLTLFFSYLFPALVLFFLAKKFFKGTFSALLPSLLFLLIRRDVVVTALTGQWNSLLSLGLLLIFIYFTHKFFWRPTLKASVKLSLLFALIILSYMFTGLAAVFFFCIYFLVFSFRKHFSFKRLFYGLLIFVLGVFLCGFYLLPLLDMPGWSSTYPGFSVASNLLELPYKVLGPFVFAVPKGVITEQLFDAFSNNHLVFLKLVLLYLVSSLPQLMIFSLGVLGIFYFFGNKEDNPAKTFLLTFFLFMLLSLLVGSGFWFLIKGLEGLPVFGNLLAYRFLIFVNVSLLIFGSYALSNLKENFYPKKLDFIQGLLSRRKVIFLIILLFFIANLNYYLPAESETLTIKNSYLSDDFFSLADWVRDNVDGSKTRIVYQDFYGNFHDPLIASSHLPSILFHYTNVYSVGGWFKQSTYPTDMLSFTASGKVFGEDLEKVDDNFIADRMRLVNANYIVSVNKVLEDKLASSNLFFKEFSNGYFSVFYLKSYSPEWISHSENFSYDLLSFKDHRIAFTYSSSFDENILVKVSYHPYWHAYLDNEEIKISRSPDSLMLLELPEGSHSVLLSYQPFKLSYLIVTLITLTGCVLALLFLRD